MEISNNEYRLISYDEVHNVLELKMERSYG